MAKDRARIEWLTEEVAAQQEQLDYYRDLLKEEKEYTRQEEADNEYVKREE